MSYIRPQLGDDSDIEIEPSTSTDAGRSAAAALPRCKAANATDAGVQLCVQAAAEAADRAASGLPGSLAQTGANIANSITAPLASLFSVFGAPAATNTAVAKKKPSLLPLAVGVALVAMFIMNKKKRSK